jgi:anti-sigma regulatory factor (Ser/Thr protein kinase)
MSSPSPDAQPPAGEAEARLPAALTSARTAREFVVRAVAGLGRSDALLVDRVALVTSELVTNAIIHARTEIRLVVRVDSRSIWIEVLDGTTTLPQPARAGPSDTSGRGLAMVAALADEWGVTETEGGKKVWARVASA